MLIIYGNYAISWVVGGNGSPAPVALTDVEALNNGRSGDGVLFRWGGGVQTTSSYFELLGTITSPLDNTAPIGGVGVINIQDLPVGTLVDVQLGSYTQRLVAGRRMELNAWLLPTAALNSNTIRIRIYNNVNGAPSIPAQQVFYVGNVIVGRLTSWKLLLDSAPSEEIMDPTQYRRSDGGQLWQLMRKPFSELSVKLGGYTTTDVVGGLQSTIPSGGNPAGVIDARSLAYYLATAPVCAVCAFPHKGPGNIPVTTTAGGFLFDIDMIQLNFMLARPTQLQPMGMGMVPYYSWNAKFQEAT